MSSPTNPPPGEHPAISTSPSTPSAAKEPPSPPPPASPLDRAFLTNQPGTAVLILVRHGQQEWPEGPNPAASEWVDPPLSAIGQRQAEVVGLSLAGDHIDAVYSSHLRRANETGAQIAKHHGIDAVVYEELREIEMFRDLPTGASIRDVVKPPFLRGMQERFVRERRWDVYPYTETSAEFRHRVVTSVEGILAEHAGERVVIACHGGVINAYVGHLLGLVEDMFFRPGHGSISRVLVGDNRRVVHTLNEIHHLAAVDPDIVTF
ncbi:MAG TPA: histidine phosphatase family protein [Acidimicrobiales bacterium]|nr:histidine phosphatase family protein [Acidimicrobiales bacterium]